MRDWQARRGNCARRGDAMSAPAWEHQGWKACACLVRAGLLGWLLALATHWGALKDSAAVRLACKYIVTTQSLFLEARGIPRCYWDHLESYSSGDQGKAVPKLLCYLAFPRELVEMISSSIKGRWHSPRGAVEMNPARSHEVAGLIPGLAQWIWFAVSCGIGTDTAQIPHCCGCAVGWPLQLPFNP